MDGRPPEVSVNLDGCLRRAAVMQSTAIPDGKSALVLRWISRLDELTMLTPSHNSGLAHRRGDFSSLVEGLDYAALGQTGFNFHDSRGRLDTVLSYRALRDAARDIAPRLIAMGLHRGDRIALVAETSPDFVTFFFACQYAGLVPAPLPLCINFGGIDAYRERLAGMIRACDARLALGSNEMNDNLKGAAANLDDTEVASFDDIRATEPALETLEPLGAADTCYIQYSSGSTSFPRGVIVTQRALTANARSIGTDGLDLVPGDRCCSWLPLYHDMGLVGCCLTPVLNQVSVDYLATTTFAKRPLLWLDLISRNQSSISFGPTFGYELCARRAARGVPENLDLSSWRVAGIGGEMIRPTALNSFASCFADAGFDNGAFLPSYGMAETTLAVTFNRLGEGVTTDRILRREAYEESKAVPATDATDSILMPVREFARCGKPMAGYRIEIRDEHNKVLPDRRIGRVFIHAPSVMDGYFREPELTGRVLGDDGWLNSGDLGYMIDGELVVTGRSKDLIIVGGRNIWPQDLEWAVESLELVRSGDSAAFSLLGDDDTEQVHLVVECRIADTADREQLRRAIRAIVQKVAGVVPEVVLTSPKSLAFTTSGKLSRAAVKSAFEQGEITDLDDGGEKDDSPSSLASVAEAA